jgi:uncharacterized FlaG/YvyC family protein
VPNLKNSVISEILDNLNCGDFCREDFTVEFPDGTSVLAAIFFTALPKYSFRIEEHYTDGNRFASVMASIQESETKKVIRTIESPGDYRNDENHNHPSIKPAVVRVVNWVENIREDLIHSRDAVRATIDQATAEFQSSIDENIENPEEYFQNQEKEDLISKLNELQKRVESLETEIGIDPKKVAVIEEAIEKSKTDIEVYPKGVWYKTVGTKLMKLLTETLKTKESRELFAEIIKKLVSP